MEIVTWLRPVSSSVCVVAWLGCCSLVDPHFSCVTSAVTGTAKNVSYRRVTIARGSVGATGHPVEQIWPGVRLHLACWNWLTKCLRFKRQFTFMLGKIRRNDLSNVLTSNENSESSPPGARISSMAALAFSLRMSL